MSDEIDLIPREWLKLVAINHPLDVTVEMIGKMAQEILALRARLADAQADLSALQQMATTAADDLHAAREELAEWREAGRCALLGDVSNVKVLMDEPAASGGGSDGD